MTLSPELSTILSACAVIIAAFAWLYAFKCWNSCRDTEEFVKKWANQRGPTVSDMTKVQTDLTEHEDSIAALHASLRKLRARIGMRENRARKGDTASEVPDSAIDPAGYKRAMRLKLGGKL